MNIIIVVWEYLEREQAAIFTDFFAGAGYDFDAVFASFFA